MLIRLLGILLVMTTNSNAKRDAAPLTTVPHVDLERYVGEWHESARWGRQLPRR
jgi:lipocalin